MCAEIQPVFFMSDCFLASGAAAPLWRFCQGRLRSCHAKMAKLAPFVFIPAHTFCEPYVASILQAHLAFRPCRKKHAHDLFLAPDNCRALSTTMQASTVFGRCYMSVALVRPSGSEWASQSRGRGGSRRSQKGRSVNRVRTKTIILTCRNQSCQEGCKACDAHGGASCPPRLALRNPPDESWASHDKCKDQSHHAKNAT